jgi:hypothetical protein
MTSPALNPRITSESRFQLTTVPPASSVMNA